MTTLTMTDFRSNMASSFDRVDAGEFVFINRGRQKTYAIIPIEEVNQIAFELGIYHSGLVEAQIDGNER